MKVRAFSMRIYLLMLIVFILGLALTAASIPLINTHDQRIAAPKRSEQLDKPCHTIPATCIQSELTIDDGPLTTAGNVFRFIGTPLIALSILGTFITALYRIGTGLRKPKHRKK